MSFFPEIVNGKLVEKKEKPVCLSKQQKQIQKHENLLKNFQGDFYQEKKVNGKWLVKYYFRPKDCWKVMCFKSEQSFRKYKSSNW